ncbi:MAG: serine hydrolase, partial [Bacteroidales bacterium]|nr:serine hydrolase [Bacteroidales bacterium]
MNRGRLYEDKKLGYPAIRQSILSPAAIRTMCTIPPENDPKVGRALGWDKKSEHSSPRGDLFNPETTLCHTGYTGTTLVIDMSTRTAIVLLTNRVHPTDDGLVGPLRSKVANIVAGSIIW